MEMPRNRAIPDQKRRRRPVRAFHLLPLAAQYFPPGEPLFFPFTNIWFVCMNDVPIRAIRIRASLRDDPPPERERISKRVTAAQTRAGTSGDLQSAGVPAFAVGPAADEEKQGETICPGRKALARRCNSAVRLVIHGADFPMEFMGIAEPLQCCDYPTALANMPPPAVAQQSGKFTNVQSVYKKIRRESGVTAARRRPSIFCNRP